MPHNFHDTNGWLIVGMDVHKGLHWPTPTPANMVSMNFAELVCAHPFTMAPGGDRNPTVLINGVESVKWQCTPRVLWPHFPLFPDPLNLLFLLDLAFGRHKCRLPKTNVIAEGTPMAPVCIWGWHSRNMDCFMWTMFWSSLVLQPGTVETTPTLADLGHGLVVVAINAAIDTLFHWATGGFKKKPVNPGAVARANWKSLGRNLTDFFKGPRARTLQRAALNRFRKEALSRFIPVSWKPGDQAWKMKNPLKVIDWARRVAGMGKHPVGLNDSGALDWDWDPTNLAPEAGEPFDPADTLQSLGENLFPPLKLLP